MGELFFPLFVLVIWVALGLTGAVFLGRHGHRSPVWYVIGIPLGAIFLPIAVEMGLARGEVISRTVSVGTDGSGATAVLALDGSPESDAALADAARVLAPMDARFVLLTVLDPDVVVHEPEAKDDAAARLAEFAARLPGAHPVTSVVAAGNPTDLILERAAAENADLLVLGRRGAGLSEHLLGSVADRVVRRAHCPVLLGRTP